MPSGTPGTLEVRYDGRRWALDRGERLTFGRSADRELRIAFEPEDLVVSRHAGYIQHDGAVWVVHNTSSRAQHTLQPRPGPPVEVGPGSTVGLPGSYTLLQVLGRDRPYEIVLDYRPVTDHRPGTARPAGGLPTDGPPEVSASERQLLAALCEPLLLYAGADARHSTPTEIGMRLDQAPRHVTRRLAELRDGLVRRGVVDLMFDTGTGAGSWTARLASWAIRYDIVTIETLSVLPRRREP